MSEGKTAWAHLMESSPGDAGHTGPCDRRLRIPCMLQLGHKGLHWSDMDGFFGADDRRNLVITCWKCGNNGRNPEKWDAPCDCGTYDPPEVPDEAL